MKSKISKVFPGSIAEEMEIQPGDYLLSINDTPVKDIIDYKFLMADEFVDIQIEKEDGEVWQLEIDKDYEEDLGVEFENAILDDARSCCNKCVFCFIDQLPKGMRDTLYFKDDDSRLSFLQGNFVTLTNLKDEDIDRIIRYRISPINISVHTTNPELRVKMLNNRFAGNIFDRLKKLSAAGIQMNCQIVLCPGLNNGTELKRTIEDLYTLYPSIQNVAAVPIGATQFREGLFKVKLYDKTSSLQELDNILHLQEKYIDEIGEPFVRLADEFYIMAEKDIPETEFYGVFDQIEDGIGMIRYLRNTMNETLKNLKLDTKGSFTMVTGTSAYEELKEVASSISNVNNKIHIDIRKIINNFFGQTITVAGLLTGKDIIEQLSEAPLGEYIILPKNMLRSGDDTFLDDLRISDIENKFNRKVLICEYTGEDLIELINQYSSVSN